LESWFQILTQYHEFAGVAGRIHVSEATCKLLPQEQWEPTGGVEVKGKVRKDFHGCPEQAMLHDPIRWSRANN